MELYHEEILEHYKHPQNYGRLSHADQTLEYRNTSCGDIIRLDIMWEKERLNDIAFEIDGCAISKASASLFTEFIKGKSREEIEKLNHHDVYALLGGEISPGRVNCALLPLDALRQILKK